MSIIPLTESSKRVPPFLTANGPRCGARIIDESPSSMRSRLVTGSTPAVAGACTPGASASPFPHVVSNAECSVNFPHRDNTAGRRRTERELVRASANLLACNRGCHGAHSPNDAPESSSISDNVVIRALHPCSSLRALTRAEFLGSLNAAHARRQPNSRSSSSGTAPSAGTKKKRDYRMRLLIIDNENVVNE